MDSSGSEGPGTRPGRWTARNLAAALVIVLCAIALAVWLARDLIATRLASAWLGRRGVASDLKIQSISLTGLTARVRLGDPADPDLSVDRLEVGYAISGPWTGQPFSVQTRSLRLVRPDLRLRLGGGRPAFGSLQTLVQELSNRPAGGGPQPDISVEDGLVRIATPSGAFRLRGDGTMRAGVLQTVKARSAPFRFTASGARIQSAGGDITMTSHDGRLQASADLGELQLDKGAQRLRSDRAVLTGELPYPTPDGRWRGPARIILTAIGVSVATGEAQAAGGDASAVLTGELVGERTHQAWAGRLQASSRFGTLVGAGAQAQDANASLDMARLVLTREGANLTASGAGQASFAARGAQRSDILLSQLNGAVRIADLKAQMGPSGQGVVSAGLEGELSGRGATSPAAARRLAHHIPVLSGEDAYAAAIDRGARAFHYRAAWRAQLSDHGARIGLASPARIDTDSGAHLTFADPGGGARLTAGGAQGSADLAVQGGGLPTLNARLRNASISASGFRAELAAEGTLDALFARGAHLKATGMINASGSRFRFDLTGCAPVTAERLTFDPNPVTAFSGQVCPSGGPLIETGAKGWSSHGALEAAQGDAPSLGARLREASGRFQAAGDASGLVSAGLVADRGQVLDAVEPLRFRPVRLEGRADLAGGAWNGAFSIATTSGHPVGTIRIRHDTRTGSGRADIDARALSFAPGALQPAELTPMANFARQAEGAAGFTGWFAWGPDAKPTSGGELIAKDLRFKSPLGLVADIDSDLHFVSLTPLITAPGQRITIAQVDAITPMTGLSATFELGTTSIGVQAAEGSIASGQVRLEPLVAPLSAGATIRGALLLDHVDIGQVLAASTLADAIKMQAVIDGRIPFEIGPDGVKIMQGHIAAVGPGRLTISRKALTGGSAATAPAAGAAGQAGFAEDLAYQAMENLAFEQLDASVNTLPGDRLGVIFHIKGRHDPPQKQQAVIAVGDLLGGRALAKPLTLPSDTQIDLTLDTSLNFGELVRALEQAVRDSMRQDGGTDRSGAVQAPKAEVAATTK